MRRWQLQMPHIAVQGLARRLMVEDVAVEDVAAEDLAMVDTAAVDVAAAVTEDAVTEDTMVGAGSAVISRLPIPPLAGVSAAFSRMLKAAEHLQLCWRPLRMMGFETAVDYGEKQAWFRGRFETMFSRWDGGELAG